MYKPFHSFLVVLLLASACAIASEASSAGKRVFAQYQMLERTFSPAAADLYCDTALIRNTRRYPDGNTRTLQFPADKYKALVRAAMPLARARGDLNTYSATTFKSEGANVRITTTRYSLLKKYSSPMSLLVGPCKQGPWAVLEEISESRP